MVKISDYGLTSQSNTHTSRQTLRYTRIPQHTLTFHLWIWHQASLKVRTLREMLHHCRPSGIIIPQPAIMPTMTNSATAIRSFRPRPAITARRAHLKKGVFRAAAPLRSKSKLSDLSALFSFIPPVLPGIEFYLSISESLFISIPFPFPLFTNSSKPSYLPSVRS